MLLFFWSNRNRQKYDFLSIQDLDEILIGDNVYSVKSLIQRLEEEAQGQYFTEFVFQQHFFYKERFVHSNANGRIIVSSWEDNSIMVHFSSPIWDIRTMLLLKVVPVS